jgi:hypothetical protein
MLVLQALPQRSSIYMCIPVLSTYYWLVMHCVLCCLLHATCMRCWQCLQMLCLIGNNKNAGSWAESHVAHCMTGHAWSQQNAQLVGAQSLITALYSCQLAVPGTNLELEHSPLLPPPTCLSCATSRSSRATLSASAARNLSMVASLQHTNDRFGACRFSRFKACI